MEKLITWLVEELFHKNNKDLQNLVFFHAMTLYQITSQGEWWGLQKKTNEKLLKETTRELEERREEQLLLWACNTLIGFVVDVQGSPLFIAFGNLLFLLINRSPTSNTISNFPFLSFLEFK